MENVEDADALNAELNRLEEKKAGLEEQKRSLSTEDGNQEAARAALAGLEVDLAKQRAAYIERSAAANREMSAEIDRMTKDRREISDRLDTLRRKHKDNLRTLTRMQEERAKLMEEYAAAQSRQWDAGAEICPTCHQQMPQNLIEELRAAFHEGQSKQKEEINRRGQACSKGKIDALTVEIDTQAADITAMENAVREMENGIGSLKASLTTPPPFEETAAYRDITARMEELRDRQRIHASAADGVKSGYDRDIASVREEIAAVNLRIAKAQASEDSRRRVGELRQELKDTAEQVGERQSRHSVNAHAALRRTSARPHGSGRERHRAACRR